MDERAVSGEDAAAPASFCLPAKEGESNRRSSVQVRAHADLQRWNLAILQQNANWFCRLRWIVVITLGLAGAGGLFPGTLGHLGLSLHPGLPLCAAALLAGLNIVFVRLARTAGARRGAWSVKRVLWLQIGCDLVVLTAVVHWLGSDLPAAPFMYLFHIILACIAFSPAESVLVLGLAATLYLVSVILETQGILPPLCVLTAHQLSTPPALSSAAVGYRVGSTFLVWAVIWYLVSWLARKLQQHEYQLEATNLQLEASCEERSAHMLQTTHQLKAPFAAIHAQTQLLLGHYCGELPERAYRVVETIAARSMALSRQIQQMLQLANLRSQGQTRPLRKELDVAQLITAAVTRVEPAARQRAIAIILAVQRSPVRVVEDHLTMLLDNLIVNAVSYSHEQGTVEIGCHPDGADHVHITVRDHGIGIAPEKLPRIFDDYYRTEEAVRHNRTSTGLGLAIVRQAARAIGATIQVDSAPKWGTRFTVTLPKETPSPIPSPKSSRN